MANKAGFIGLGIMGKPMAQHLVSKGFELLVNDVSQEAMAELQELGATPASLAEIGAQCEVLLTCLPNGGIVQQVLFGAQGLTTSIRPGTIVVDHSSVTPEQSRTCAAKLADLGVAFLDAPISGGEPKAITGELAIMVGGEQEIYDRVLPYFQAYGSKSTLTGGVGSGSITKLVNQILVNLTIAVVSEGLVFAEKAGADPALVYEAINTGLAQSSVLDAKAPMILARNFKPGGKISVNHKDITNVLASAHSLDIPVPLTAQLFEILQTLKNKGCMDEDHGAIVKYFEMLAGVEVGCSSGR